MYVMGQQPRWNQEGERAVCAEPLRIYLMLSTQPLHIWFIYLCSGACLKRFFKSCVELTLDRGKRKSGEAIYEATSLLDNRVPWVMMMAVEWREVYILDQSEDRM